MLLFTNGLLLGLLLCCAMFCAFLIANRPKRKRRTLPKDHQNIERKNGAVSFVGQPGMQNIPCRIEIYHTFRYSWNERMRAVEDHSELRRYCLNIPLPTAVCCADQNYFNVVDSDGICLAVYVGSIDTLVQA